VLIGAGCACGAGGSLRVAEFEQQILDYLAGKHGAARNFDSLQALLRSIATQPPAGEDPGPGLSLLDDLKRTLDSFDELHRTR